LSKSDSVKFFSFTLHPLTAFVVVAAFIRNAEQQQLEERQQQIEVYVDFD